MYVLGILGIFLLVVIILLTIPFSPLKKSFNEEVRKELEKCSYTEEVFTQEDIQGLPLPVQRYFQYCGFIGKRKMANGRIVYKNVIFKMGVDKPDLKIKYQHYNFVKKPVRMAFIDSRLYGIPFQGRDKYQNGKGAMTGTFAKVFTLFDSKGEEMDQASLVTHLAEGIFIPNVLLQDYITWEAIDESHAKATIEWQGTKASGIFTFNKKGEMESFETEDRYMDTGEGTPERRKWTCKAQKYIETKGIKHPSVLKGIWNLPDQDFVYFDGEEIAVEYDVK